MVADGWHIVLYSDGMIMQGQTLYSGKHPSKSVRIVYAEDISSDNADDTDAR
jgi:hypothetical protein